MIYKYRQRRWLPFLWLVLALVIGFVTVTSSKGIPWMSLFTLLIMLPLALQSWFVPVCELSDSSLFKSIGYFKKKKFLISDMKLVELYKKEFITVYLENGEQEDFWFGSMSGKERKRFLADLESRLGPGVFRQHKANN